MSELAVERMTLAEFLRWEDGTDTRYELLYGVPVAMAPPAVADDRQDKIPAYRMIPSVQEILALDSTRMVAEVMRREGDKWTTEIVLGASGTLSLALIGLTVAMAELYEGIELPEPPPRCTVPRG
jgi:Uma2 family endonuclease